MSINSPQYYNVIFSGKISSGFNHEVVKATLASIYQNDIRQIEFLFNGRKHFLKSRLERPKALRYCSAFKNLGMVCVIRKTRIAKKTTRDIELSSCGYCGILQPLANHCKVCNRPIQVQVDISQKTDIKTDTSSDQDDSHTGFEHIEGTLEERRLNKKSYHLIEFGVAMLLVALGLDEIANVRYCLSPGPLIYLPGVLFIMAGGFYYARIQKAFRGLEIIALIPLVGLGFVLLWASWHQQKKYSWLHRSTIAGLIFVILPLVWGYGRLSEYYIVENYRDKTAQQTNFTYQKDTKITNSYTKKIMHNAKQGFLLMEEHDLSESNRAKLAASIYASMAGYLDTFPKEVIRPTSKGFIRPPPLRKIHRKKFDSVLDKHIKIYGPCVLEKYHFSKLEWGAIRK